MKTTNGLYIHIPFCLSKCTYCDFYSVSQDTETMELYANAIVDEIERVSVKLKSNDIDTIYIGGGTPSVLPLYLLEKIVNSVYKHFNVKSKEFTIEANPATNIPFSQYRKLGIDRLSLGVQTLNDKILSLIGRRHDKATALSTIDEARKHFNNISCDLMLGLPTQTMIDVEHAVNELTSLVNHLSVYMLKLSSGVKMQRDVDAGILSLPDDDLTVDFYDKAYSIMKDKAFNRYEISNFAHNGFESLHNLKYWNREDYIGIGASAHGFVEGYRYFNPSSLKDYINGINYGKDAVELEHVAKKDAMFEAIMLALRLREGLDVNAFNNEFSVNFNLIYEKPLFMLQNLLENFNGNVRIKEEYMLLESAIAREFII